MRGPDSRFVDRLPLRIQAVQPYYRTEEVLESLGHVLAGDFQSGNAVSKLEDEFSRYHGSAGCVAMPYARIGLYYALKALDLPRGSEVLLTPITIPDMVNVIVSAGLKPRFVDMDVGGLNYSSAALERAVSRNTRVVLITYLYGIVPHNIEDIIRIAKNHDLRVIEDVSQALGATFGKNRLGTLGDVGIYSLSSMKVCASLYGGLVISNDTRLIGRIRNRSGPELSAPARGTFFPLISKILMHRVMMDDFTYSLLTFRFIHFLTRRFPRFHQRFQTGDIGLITGLGRITRYSQVPQKLLYRYADFQATMGIKALERLDEVNGRLVEYASILESSEGIQSSLPRTSPAGQNVYWRFPVFSEDVPDLTRRLADRGIETSINALPVLSEQACFEEFRPEPCPNATTIHEKYLLVPLYAWSSNRKVRFTGKVLSELLDG